MPGQTEIKFVVVAIYNNYIEAHLAMGLLHAENINCWLKDENTVTIDPLLTNAVGGIKLMVAELQSERALKILQESKKKYQNQNPCPDCGSVNVEYVSTPRKASNWIGTLVSAVLGAWSAMPIDKVYHCFNCGYEFE